MSGKRILSDQQIEEMRALRERGWSTQRIADHFTEAGTPISCGSISWQCIRIGADVPKRLRSKTPVSLRPGYTRGGKPVRLYTPEEDEQLRALDHEGLTASQIARRLGRKPNSVMGRLYTLARHEARAEDE